MKIYKSSNHSHSGVCIEIMEVIANCIIPITPIVGVCIEITMRCHDNLQNNHSHSGSVY